MAEATSLSDNWRVNYITWKSNRNGQVQMLTQMVDNLSFSLPFPVEEEKIRDMKRDLIQAEDGFGSVKPLHFWPNRNGWMGGTHMHDEKCEKVRNPLKEEPSYEVRPIEAGEVFGYYGTSGWFYVYKDGERYGCQTTGKKCNWRRLSSSNTIRLLKLLIKWVIY